PNTWTIAPGTPNSPAFTTPAWNTVWDAADGVTSTAAIGGTATGIPGWNTSFADTNTGAGMMGYVIAFPSTGGGSIWAGSAGESADDGTATAYDLDRVAGRMGSDARITVPTGTAPGTYTVDVYGIGHDGTGKTYVKQGITVTVKPAVISASPVSMNQGTGPTTVTITGPGFTNTGLSVSFSGTGVSAGTATYVSATQITVPVTVTAGATLGARDVTVTCSGQSGVGTGVVTVTGGLTATTTTVSNPSSITYGQTASFTATVSPSAATGTVQFKVDGANVGSPATLSGGTATISGVSGLTAGNRSVTAVYSGDASYATSTSSAVTQVVIKATPTMSVTNSPVTYNGSAQAATVNGSVAGSVTSVQYNGSGTVPTNAATYAITANFAPTDSTNYNSLTAASAGNFVISKADQTIGTITFTPASLAVSGTTTASATATSSLTVSFSSDTPAVCTVSGSV